jgi:RNA-directed DNA polymerase
VPNFNLVVPPASANLANAAAMRITDTSLQPDLFGAGDRSGAVSPPYDRSEDPRRGDVDSTAGRRTAIGPTTPSCRTSATETRTTTTSRIPSSLCSSADRTPVHHAGFSFGDLVTAYLDCRRNKRRKASSLAFEMDQEAQLYALYLDLKYGRYRPGNSSCFIITHPKFREVWAAPFRDRVVHRLVYNAVHEAIERGFIADSGACIKGRGTLYGARRLEAKIRSASQNWSRPTWYLKLDLANFFVSIDKRILQAELERRIKNPWALELALQILWNDPRVGAVHKSSAWLRERVPPHKRLEEAADGFGLPIGNLTSQFFANILLDVLDQFVKHVLKVKHYVRYVDDMVLLSNDPAQLEVWRKAIEAFLPARLGLALNPRKTVCQRVDNGVDFCGHVIRPWRTQMRRCTLENALRRIRDMDAGEVFASANSYFGLAGQSLASHGDRARIACAVRRRGHAINRQLTKCYRRKAA